MEKELTKRPSEGKKQEALPDYTKNLETLKPKTGRSIVFGLFFLALFLVTPGYFVYRYYTIGPQVYAQFYEPLSLAKATSNTIAVSDALISYNNTDYASAEAQFKAAAIDFPEQTHLPVLVGICALNQKKYLEAQIIFDKVNPMNLGAYNQAFDWYSAMSSLANREQGAAIERLDKIRENPQHDFYLKAGEVLDRLR